MNNFLDICRVVNTMAGIQGTVDDCVNPIGIQVQVVESVRQAWIQLQMIRPDLMFLYKTVDFNTTANQETYNNTYIWPAGSDLGSFDINQVIYDRKALRYVPWSEYVFKDQTNTGPPEWFSFDPQSQDLYINKPDAIYAMTLGYFRRPQKLTANTDVPICNPMHFYAIVYKALEGLAVQTGNSGIFTKYASEAAIAFGQFMRSYVQRKTVALGGGFA